MFIFRKLRAKGVVKGKAPLLLVAFSQRLTVLE